jgi:hypothetical protein
MGMRTLAAAAALALAALAGSARAADTGTLVVRLVTDPTPAGVTWTYAGAGPAFKLGTGATAQRSVSLAAGTYRLAETPTAGGPASLTALACTDPTRDTHVSVAAATADVALAAGETITCTFTHRALGPRPAASAVALAAQFAPTLRLAATEHYRPLAMQDYVARATLRTGSPPGGTTLQQHPTLFSLPVAGGASYLDVRGPQPYLHASQYRTIEQSLESVRRPTVYWRIAHQPSTGRIAIEYWFLYLYNDFLDRHEADWEGVTVFVDNGAPLGASFSQHQGRTWSAWPAALADDHPVVYVAAGSHANYPAPGSYRVKVCWTLTIRRCTTSSERDNARGDGATLSASDYDLQPLGGTGFTGSWGSGSYVLGFGLARDRVVDPRRRSDYSNPFAAVPPGA